MKIIVFQDYDTLYHFYKKQFQHEIEVDCVRYPKLLLLLNYPFIERNYL